MSFCPWYERRWQKKNEKIKTQNPCLAAGPGGGAKPGELWICSERWVKKKNSESKMIHQKEIHKNPRKKWNEHKLSS